MRSASSVLLLVLLLVPLGCGSTNEEARREFNELERSLTAISAAPVEDWPARLEELRKQPLTDPSVREVRTQCIAAYEAYTTAAARLRDARRQVATVELETKRLTDGDGGIAIPALGKLHRQATESTGQVGTSLDLAQQLVDSCRQLRDELRARYESN